MKGKKQTNKKKITKQKTKQKKMLRSNQQKANQTEKHPPRPRPASRRTPPQGSTSAGWRRAQPQPPGSSTGQSTPPDAGKGSVFYQVFLPRPPTPRHMEPSSGAGRRPGQEERAYRTRPLLTAAPRGSSWAGAGREGASFPFPGLWLRPHHLLCGTPGPSRPSCRADIHVLQTWKECAGRQRLADQQPWGLTQQQGLMWFQNCGVPRPPSSCEGAPGQPSQDGLMPERGRLGALGSRTCSDRPSLTPFLEEALGLVCWWEGCPAAHWDEASPPHHHPAEPSPAGEKRGRPSQCVATGQGWSHGAVGLDGHTRAGSARSRPGQALPRSDPRCGESSRQAAEGSPRPGREGWSRESN